LGLVVLKLGRGLPAMSKTSTGNYRQSAGLLEGANSAVGKTSYISMDGMLIGEMTSGVMRNYCPFQSKADTNSNAKRTVIPIQSGHLFQSKADSNSNL
jgi:hypothetical protein